MNSFYNREDLYTFNFKKLGENVLISKKASIYGAERISLGNNVRIDDFCVLSAGSGGIEIGSFVHIAVYCSLQGDGKIIISDFCGLSSKVSIYSSNDDYLGKFLSNPTVPSKYRGVYINDVILEKHVLVGSGTVILPGVTIKMGAAIGALSLVDKNCEEFFIYKGNPIQKFMRRFKKILELEKHLKNDIFQFD